MSSPAGSTDMRDHGDRLMLGARGPRQLMLRLYQPGDEAKLELRGDFASLFAASGGVVPGGPKWTITEGGRPIAVGGLRPVELGPVSWFFSGWALAGDLRPRHWLFALEAARQVIGLGVGRLGGDRVEAMARVDQVPACRLLLALGLKLTAEVWPGADGSRHHVFSTPDVLGET